MVRALCGSGHGRGHNIGAILFLWVHSLRSELGRICAEVPTTWYAVVTKIGQSVECETLAFANFRRGVSVFGHESVRIC